MFGAALEPLDEEECLAFLGTTTFGRVAVVTQEGRPEILPINFILLGKTVVFSTSSAVLVNRAPLSHVAFEADYIDPVSQEGWDVVVTGEGEDITNALDRFSALAQAQVIDHWAPGPKDNWISIVNPRFSGRRLYVPAPAPTFG